MCTQFHHFFLLRIFWEKYLGNAATTYLSKTHNDGKKSLHMWDSHTSCDRPNKIYKLRHCSKHLCGKVVATRTIYQKHKVQVAPTFGGTTLKK